MGMAYRFKRDIALVQDGVRKIAGGLINKAINCAKAKRKDVNEVVHFARKSCKTLRGLIRLVRSVFGEYEPEKAVFRDAGSGLSAAAGLRRPYRARAAGYRKPTGLTLWSQAKKVLQGDAARNGCGGERPGRRNLSWVAETR